MPSALTSSSVIAVATFVLGAAACATGAWVEEEPRADHPPLGTPCPVVTRVGACRAAGMRERVTIASGGMLLPAAGFAVGDAGYAAFAVRWGDAKILSSKSERAWAFDAASALP